MKKTLCIGLVLFSFLSGVFAQNGLERVLVERYYKSTAADTIANADGGRLPVGSITYRVYADLLPGYKFQAIYGVPGHELRIATSTLFFNNEDRGDITPSYTKAQARNNTVMLDSWISAGAACLGQIGVPKDEDFDSSATVVNNYSPQVLQNDDSGFGIPVKDQDGMVSGTPCIMTPVGVSTEIAVFGSQNDGTNGPVFSTTNGSCACLGGTIGADSTINKVLIGQFTTDGILSFKLNIQIGTPSGGVENYVAENPVGAEIFDSTLSYTSPSDTAMSVSYHPPAVNQQLVLYPNPAGDRVYMLFPEGFQPLEYSAIRVFSPDGKEVISTLLPVNGRQMVLPLPDTLADGTYFICVLSGGKQFNSVISRVNN